MNYWRDHYGTCALPPKQCKCLQEGPWLGEGCLNWQTLGIESFEQLKEYINRVSRKIL